MKAYSTFAGAQRAANGKPIVRLLDDPTEIWIVVDRYDLNTDVMVFTTGGGSGIQSRKYENAGRTTLFDIASRDETDGSTINSALAPKGE